MSRYRKYKYNTKFLIWILISLMFLCISMFMIIYTVLNLNKDIKSFELLSKTVEKSDYLHNLEYNKYNELNSDNIFEKYNTLFNDNNDFFGWIKIEDTVLNYPVMYTPNNPEYYLNHSFNKEKSFSGVPFLDGSWLEGCGNYIIYGHNMKNGTMFQTILNYEDKKFFEEHPIIKFDTLYETGEYEVVGSFYSEIFYEDQKNVFRFYSYKDVSDFNTYNEYIDNVKKISLYDTGITPIYGEDLLTLVTCSYNTENGRFVVVARKIENNIK